MKTTSFDWLALLLAIFGAITWGVLGVTGLMGESVNLVALLLEPIFRPGPGQTFEYLVYVVVGMSGVYLVTTSYRMARASRRATRERKRRDATRAETKADRTRTTDRSDTDNTES